MNSNVDTAAGLPAPDAVGSAESVDGHEQLIVSLDGFEGPIDMLLGMAREQKVDLTQVSILQLADQYLTFIGEMRSLRIELAADYLVMAAWLAYLKSRLLLPDTGNDEEPTGEELAAALAFQLKRLEAMRGVAGKLLALPQRGRDFFARGAPEGIAVHTTSIFELSLYELLKTYGEHKQRLEASTFKLPPSELYSIEEAVERLSEIIGRTPDWSMLASLMPRGSTSVLSHRSAIASTFVASLELTKTGKTEIRQDGPFAPIWVRRVPPVR